MVRVAVLCSLATLAATVLTSAQSPAMFRVRWSQSLITTGLSPGDIGAQRVTFTISVPSSEPLAIEVVPSLARFVHVQPATVVTSPTGVVVTLRFVIPADAVLGQHDGTVHVRSGRRTLPDPLKVRLLIQPPTQPPDPGIAGSTTIEGIDSNGDGVRDDVERYIWSIYPASQPVRNLLRQYAIATEAALLDAANRNASRVHAAEVLLAQDCLRRTAGADGARQILDGLTPKLLNTVERTRAYLRRNLGSYVIDPNQFVSAPCTF